MPASLDEHDKHLTIRARYRQHQSIMESDSSKLRVFYQRLAHPSINSYLPTLVRHSGVSDDIACLIQYTWSFPYGCKDHQIYVIIYLINYCLDRRNIVIQQKTAKQKPLKLPFMINAIVSNKKHWMYVNSEKYNNRVCNHIVSKANFKFNLISQAEITQIKLLYERDNWHKVGPRNNLRIFLHHIV